MNYRWDDFVLDLDAYRLERAGTPLALEPKAFNLLALMVERPGHLFSKQEIFDAIWPDTAVTDHALTRVVAQLRRVLGDEAREARYIETVPTRGYRWVRPVEAVVVAATPAPAVSAMPAARPAEPDAPTATPAAIAAPAHRRALIPALAAILCVLTALLAAAVWTPREAATTSTPAVARDVRWPVQVTTNAGLDLHPSLSPQGDAVAYVSDRSGTFEIYVRAFGGTANESPLTRDGGHNMQPAWSPDGRFIAYHSVRHGGIWVVAARGGAPKQIAMIGSNPSWSPDGGRIAFQSDEHTDVTPAAFGAQSGSTIWIMDADGRHLRQLTRAGSPIGGHAAPAWTHDRRHIAFTVFEGDHNNGIWIVALDSGETRQLQHGAGLFELVFAPDDSALYVAGGESLIVRYPFDAASGSIAGAREVLGVPGVPGVRGLSISTDGQRLAFAGLALSSHIWAQPLDREGLAAGPAKPLTTDTSRRTSLPAISPDGSQFTYMASRGGEAPNVWLMNIDGTGATQVTSDETAEFKPQWLPDGKRLTYFSNRGGVPALWTVDLATRREEVLFDLQRTQKAQQSLPFPLTGRLAEFDLSPSMTRVAFALFTPPGGERVMFAATINPFAPRALTDARVSVGYPSWSPNERFIAVEIKEGSSTHAGIIDVETATLRTLTNARGQTWVRSWSPDSRKVAAATLREGVWSLQWIDIATGRQGTMKPPEAPRVYVRYPEWSPRGNVVLFERGELRGNIWILALR